MLFQRLQSIQNAAARLVTGTTRSEHIQPVLRLHWLPVRQRVDFKLATLVYQALHGLLYVVPVRRLSTHRRHRPSPAIRLSNTNICFVPRLIAVLVTEVSPLPALHYGTVYQHLFAHLISVHYVQTTFENLFVLMRSVRICDILFNLRIVQMFLLTYLSAFKISSITIGLVIKLLVKCIGNI